MSQNFVNPYNGKQEESCSVSFGAQQQMGAHQTGSSQTEAEYNKSKLLGEWGVIKAKLHQQQFPEGTKLLTFSNNTNGQRGFLYVKGGQLQMRVYKPNNDMVDFKAVDTQGETFINSKYYTTAIPESAASKADANLGVAAKVKAAETKYEQDYGISPEFAEASKRYGPSSVKLLKNGQPVVWANLDDFGLLTPGKDFILHGPVKNAYTSQGKHVTIKKTLNPAKTSVQLIDDNGDFAGQQQSGQAKWWIELVPDDQGKTALTPQPKVIAKSSLSGPEVKTIAAPTPVTAVNAGSTSVGSMSHEDVSAMFVKIKDDLAKEQGLNIKGANPELDQVVYSKIGEATGYTAAEVKAKIDAYKADGNKLSALKKKVLSGTKKVPVIASDPPKKPGPVPDLAAVVPKASSKVPVTAKEAVDKLLAIGKNDKGYVLGGTSSLGLKPAGDDALGLHKLTDKLSKDAGLSPTDLKTLADKYGEDFVIDADVDVYTGQDWVYQAVVKKYINKPGDGSVLAVRRNGKLIVVDGNHRAAAAKLTNTSVKMRVLDLDKPLKTEQGNPKPNGVPTTATNKLADEVKVEVQQVVNAAPAKHYTDEDVASAYIIAKDNIVATNQKGWTLYTKNDEFDAAIAQAVKAQTGLEPLQQKQAVANYLSTGKKLSSLKKQLAKQGAFEPKADSLKKSGGAKSQGDKTKDVNDKADAGYTPSPTPASAGSQGMPTDTGKEPPQRVKKESDQSGDISGIDQATQKKIFDDFKAKGALAYLSSGSGNNYDAFVEVQAKYGVQGQEFTLLQLIRVVDDQGAKKAGVDNGKLFEKKVASWLTTSEGTTHIKQAETKKAKLLQDAKDKAEAAELAKKLMANQPPLPADSALFDIRSKSWAEDFWRTNYDNGNKITAAQKQGLVHYTTNPGYTAMNAELRSGGGSESTRRYIKNARAAMTPAPEDILVHRGTTARQFKFRDYGDDELLWGITGKTFKDEGFLSTSVAGKAAFGGKPVIMEIECPKGTPMQYVDTISRYPGENEMLLGDGLEYKVLRVENRNGKWVVRLRVVNWPGKVN